MKPLQKIYSKIFRLLFFFSSLLIFSSVFTLSVHARPGDIDPTFGDNGKVITQAGRFSADYAHAMARQPDGKLIIAGRFINGLYGGFAVVRLNTDGSLDNSFGSNGIFSFTPNVFSGQANALALQPDGKIVVGGFSTNFIGEQTFTLIRLNINGIFDTTFGSNGLVETSFGESGLYAYLNAISIQPDGKIVASGSYNFSGFPTSAGTIIAARYNPNGSLDTSFDGDGKVFVDGASNRVTSQAIQSDGKIVLAGSSNGAFAAIRLNANGSLDTSFDGDGIAVAQIGNNSAANAVLIAQNGKIILAGAAYNGTANDTALARFNSDGSLDASFDGDGKVTISLAAGSDSANGIGLQPDGKIVVGGQASINNNGSNADFAAARFNSDGSLDPSFDGDGFVMTSLSDSDEQARALIVQPDGKIVAAGYVFTTNYELAAVRYNPNGSLDSSFESDGKALHELRISTDLILTAEVQSDGKLVAGGYRFNGVYREFAVARYNADGRLDLSFGNGGITSTQIRPAASSIIKSLVIQPDGKIVAVGSINSPSDFALARYNANGSLDSSFGSGGIVTTNVGTSDNATRAALQADGKIVVAGYSLFTGSRRDFIVARYNADGSLDTSFDSDGIVKAAIGNADDIASGLAIQNDGKILVSGTAFDFANPPNNYGFAVARFNPDGSPDASFDNDGKVIVRTPNYLDEAQDMALQSDGRIVVAGFSYFVPSPNNTIAPGFALFRFNPNGSLDASFGDGGKSLTAVGQYAQAYAVKIQPDGKIIAAGSVYDGAKRNFALARFNSNGAVDENFGIAGRIITQVSNGEDEIYALALQSDGNIVAAGYSDAITDFNFALVRYLSDEALVNAPFDFDGDGKSDISIFRPSDGIWYLLRSQAGFAATRFGLNNDLLAPADYDGDGKTDVAVFRQGNWFIVNSTTNQFYAIQFGAAEDLPRPGDFDGDGRADISVFRPSNGTWYRLNSSNNQFVAFQFGTNGDIPLVADFDGDGKSDFSVYRPSGNFWYWINSSNNQFVGLQFGTAGDIPLPADFDGDGKTDVSVFRPSEGNWYRINSSNNQFAALNFGLPTDIPAPADYDGDGKADISVFRPSNGTWYRTNSANNSFYVEQFGANGDKPIPSSFNQ